MSKNLIVQAFPKFIGLSLLLLLMLSQSSCKKEDDEAMCGPTFQEFSAVIKDHGPIAADGCGWLVEIDGVLYHPTNLASNFQQDNLGVVIQFQELEEPFRCGLAATEYPAIEIVNISL